MNRLVILAPNWLGDAVMALPAIADVRRAAPGTHIAVAARPPVAPMFTLVPAVATYLFRGTRPMPRHRGLEWLTERYARLVGRAVRHARITVAGAVVIVAGAVWLGAGVVGGGVWALVRPGAISNPPPMTAAERVAPSPSLSRLTFIVSSCVFLPSRA